jgi:UDP-glucose 4-epimerase
MRCLVVGGAGFVGGRLVRKLLEEGASVHILDNLLSSERFNVPEDPRASFTEGSIEDDRVLYSLEDEYDVIFHLATYHGNQSSIHNPLADHKNNTLTTLKLFERVKHFLKLKKIVYSGAGCAVAEKTFDEAKACEEVDVVSLDMDSPYSLSKIFGEFYAKYYFKQHGLPVVRARFQNVFGPGEILGAGQWRGTPATVWRNVVPTFIYKALKQQPLTVENNGIATRDFIFVEDIVEGLMACAERGQPGEVYNLATGGEVSIMTLAETINAITENPVPCRFLPKRGWDQSGRRFGCPKKSAKELGFSAKKDLEGQLRKTIEWTQDNLSLIEQTIKKHDRYLES